MSKQNKPPARLRLPFWRALRTVTLVATNDPGQVVKLSDGRATVTATPPGVVWKLDYLPMHLWERAYNAGRAAGVHPAPLVIAKYQPAHIA